MTAAQLFTICNGMAIFGWLLLLLPKRLIQPDKFIIGIIVTLLALVYCWFIFNNFSPEDTRKFSSLKGVMELFTSEELVLAGWVHYLAFDLLAGLFIRHNAQLHRINHWLTIPCLLLTFMLGPAGLLLYLIIRTFSTRRYFSKNF